MDLVISHVRSDFDAVAATVAGARLYPGAVAVLQDDLQPTVRRYLALYKDALGLRHLAELPLDSVQRVILVDTASSPRSGRLAAALAERPVEWIVFDHHPPADAAPPGHEQHFGDVGATTTLLVRELERRGVDITAVEATTMLLGIYDDTGCLTYVGTRPADALAVAWLLARGARLDVVAKFLVDEFDEQQAALFDELLQASAPSVLKGRQVWLAGTKVEAGVNDIAGVVHRLLAVHPVDCALVVVEHRHRTQIVARGRIEGLDLPAVLAPYGGRGHALACAGHAKDQPWKVVLADLRTRLEASLPRELLAGDLMSAPVRTAAPGERVAEVRERLQRYGHTALVVVDGLKLAGILSRRDLDRAFYHGLAHARVREIMTREVVTATPETPFSELEALIQRHDIGRLPIVRAEAVVGIVTRADVLRVLGERAGHRRDPHPAVSEWTRRLQALWPEPWLALLAQVGAIAAPRPLYLVGGAVRDLLIGRPNLDVDLVIEGDAIALASEVTAQLPGAMLTTHPTFGTAQVTLADGRKLDFATARTEHYERPAALPTVEFSSIKQDLARRDFSVNALALRVDPGHFGELLDFFRGREAIAARALHVLHPMSFLEDPTRLLRAVRFERQLGFALAPESEAYAHFALADGRFDGLAGERIKQDFRRLLLAPEPLGALQRLEALDAWRLIDAGLRPAEPTWDAVRRLQRILRRANLDQDPLRWLAYLAIVLRQLSPDRVRLDLVALQLTAAEAKFVELTLAIAGELADAEALAPIDLVVLLNKHSELAIALLVALATPATRRVLLHYWREWRPLKLTVDGNDVAALGLPPGPAYARVLREVLRARLDGSIATAADERALLARLVAELLKGSP